MSIKDNFSNIDRFKINHNIIEREVPYILPNNIISWNHEEDKEKIKKFLDDVNNELKELLKPDNIRKYLHEDYQALFIVNNKWLTDLINIRIDNAKEYIDNTDIKTLYEKLLGVGWAHSELAFKIKFWNTIKGRIGDWLVEKLDTINLFLGSLGSAGIPGMDAIREIKDAFEIATKKESDKKRRGGGGRGDENNNDDDDEGNDNNDLLSFGQGKE